MLGGIVTIIIQLYVFYICIRNFEKMISYRDPKILSMVKKMSVNELNKEVIFGELSEIEQSSFTIFNHFLLPFLLLVFGLELVKILTSPLS